jgi:hypothetical protein
MISDQASGLFQTFAKATVGDGKTILFWKDRWIHGRTASEFAPEVAALVPTRRKNTRKVGDALIQNLWIQDITGDLTVEACTQCIVLWEEIDSVQRNTQEPDTFCWSGSKNGKYNAHDTYKRLCLGQIEFSMDKPILRSFAPLKCKIFGWLAVKDRHWTSERRFRHGLQEVIDPCFTCLQERDSMNHILAQCPYARQVWFGCLRSAGLILLEPGQDSTLEDWWRGARGRVHKEDRRKFDTLVILVAWSLWKQWNARVFGNIGKQCDAMQLTDRIKAEFELWELARAARRRGLSRE